MRTEILPPKPRLLKLCRLFLFISRKAPGRKNQMKTVCLWLGFTPLLIVLGFYWHQTLFLEYEGLFGYGQVEDYGLPAALMDQFRLYDTNADGYIDPYEFSFLQYHLDQVSWEAFHCSPYPSARLRLEPPFVCAESAC